MIMNLIIMRKKWSSQNRTDRTGSAATDIIYIYLYLPAYLPFISANTLVSCLSPYSLRLYYYLLVGGQEAMEVITTTTIAGKFEALFIRLVFEETFWADQILP